MKALALIFEGFEELEAVAPFALLRRAGIELTIASNQSEVTGSHHISLSNLNNYLEIKFQSYDCLILPGGSHYKYIKENKYIHTIIDYFMKKKKLVAAICAAPTILGMLGYLENKKYTCFTSMNEDFKGFYLSDGVVLDGNLITAKSVAYSIDFAFYIIQYLAGDECLNKVKKQIYYEK